MDDQGRPGERRARILNGHVDEFETVIQDYQRLVSHIVFRLVANQADREDICQEVFVKVYRNLASFQSKSKLSTWIGRIAYNTSINHLEKKRVPLLDDISSEEKGIDNEPSAQISPFDSARQTEMSEILREAIMMLPTQYQMVVTLFHLEEMSYQEISEVMGLPEGTLKSHLFRARKLLKKGLTETYRQEDLCQ